MSYTSLEELNFPDALGNKILINRFEPVEDATDNRGSSAMAASTDWLAALIRAQWSIEAIPVTQVTLNWDYATKTLTVSGGNLIVELAWYDPGNRLGSNTRIILQQGAHLLGANTDIYARLDVGADRTIAPSAVDIVTDNAFVEGSTSIAALQARFDDIGSTDFINTPDYLGTESVLAQLPLIKVTGRSVSLFGGKIRIRDTYDYKLLDRDTQYVQVVDDVISSTATAGAWTLTGQDSSAIAFGDNSSVTMGDNASWVSGDGTLVSFGSGTTDINVAGTLDLEVGGFSNNAMKFLGEFEAGVWDGSSFDASLQFTLIDTFLKESRGGDIILQNTNLGSGGIDLSTVSGPITSTVGIGDFVVDVSIGDVVLDTNNGTIQLITGTSGDLDVDVDSMFMDLGSGASYIDQDTGSFQIRTSGAGVPLDLLTQGVSSSLSIYTQGAGGLLDITTEGANSDLTVETLDINARLRLRTLQGWTSPTHPGSYVDIQSPGGVNIGRSASGDIETLPDPVTALFIDTSVFPLGDGDVEGTTVGFLNTRISDTIDERLSILRWMGYESGDPAGVPHYQAEVRVAAGETAATPLSSWSLWVNDGAGVASLIEMLHVGGYTAAEDKVSVINVPFLVDEDGDLDSIPDFTFDYGAAQNKAAVRSTDTSGTILGLINTDNTDTVEDRKAGVAFGGYQSGGGFVNQGAILAMGQGANDDALIRHYISDSAGAMERFLDVTNAGGAGPYSQFFGDVQIEDLITTAQADFQAGAQFSGDLSSTNSSIPKAQNQVWAAAEVNLNAAVTVTATGTHAPSTTGLIKKMRTDSIIRITGTDIYEIRMTEALPNASTAMVVPVITYNVTGYTQYQAHISSITAQYIQVIIKDAAGVTVNEGGLAGDLHVTFWVLRGE